MKKGVMASEGYAIGTAFIINTNEFQINEEEIVNTTTEKAKLTAAIEKAREQLTQLCEKAKSEMSENEAAILSCQLQFLDDPEFTGAAMKDIEANLISATKAVCKIMGIYTEIFSNLEDEYLRERVADIQDIGMRLLKILAGKANNCFSNMPENAVIVAHDLTPSDTVQIDKSRVAAFATDIGGPTSHSTIMARTLEIPSVVGLADITTSAKSGDTIIVDGSEGVVFVNPDETLQALYQKKKVEFEASKKQLKALIHIPTITKAGKHIILAANIGKPDDVSKVIAVGADGIGLFRTEFLFMDRKELPTEEEQFQAYKQVAQAMEGKPVVIRTLDIGGDKKLPYLPLPEEMNPFLGLRAIRLCLKRKDLFMVQLRALLRAAVHGNIQIMFPMISSLEEFIKTKEIVYECMAALEAGGKSYNKKVALGMMIEIPSAALIAEKLAKEVDFFSIGTNDLIQYTLAVDRMNENVSYLYNPMHPAILHLIQITIAAAHKEGKWCGMCGEMAANINFIPTLLEYGLDEFSMSASSLLSAKKAIIES